MSNEQRAEVLARRSYEILIERLESYRDKPGQRQKEALKRIVGGMAHQAYGLHPGRWGYGLATGGGKSTAVAAFIAAAQEVDPSLTVAVASSRISNLQEIHDVLVSLEAEYGVGVLHAETDRHEFPPSDRPDEARYLLTTHEQLRGGERKLTRYAYVHEGDGAYRKRDVFLYDEAFLATDRVMIDLIDMGNRVHGALANFEFLGFKGSHKEVAHAAYTWLSEAHTTLKEAVVAKEEEGVQTNQTTLPELPEVYWPQELADAITPADQKILGPLFTHQDAHVVRVEAHKVMAWFDVAIPDELSDMIILDASIGVSALTKYAKSVKIAQMPSDVVRYDNTWIMTSPVAVGRSTLEGMFRKPTSSRKTPKPLKAWETLMDDLAHYLRWAAPRDHEAVIIWTRKPATNSKVVFSDEIHKAMVERGIDMDAVVPGRTIVDPETGKLIPAPKYPIKTFGQETATNQYSYAEHSAFVGVMYRTGVDLVTQVQAEKRDMTWAPTRAQYHEIVHADTAAAIYQAHSRTQSRRAVLGQAMPSTMWLPIFQREVVEILSERAFPGSQVMELETESEKLVKEKRAKTRKKQEPRGAKAEVAKVISHVLHRQDHETKSISFRKINGTLKDETRVKSDPHLLKGLKHTPLTAQVLKEAHQIVASSPPEGWSRSGQSYFRI